MWIIGHTAFAYLLIKFKYRVTKKRLDPNLIIFIFIFANLLDSLHFGNLRFFTHNQIGTVFYSLLWLFIFEKCKIIKKKDYVDLLIAVAAHVIGDILFSSYYIIYLFNITAYSIYGWNSTEHLIIGSVIVMLFITIFLFSGDSFKLENQIQEIKKNLFKGFSLKKIFNNSFFPFYLFLIFYLFTLIQFMIFIMLFFDVLLSGIWIFWIFLIVFSFFTFVMTAILFGFFKIFRKS